MKLRSNKLQKKDLTSEIRRKIIQLIATNKGAIMINYQLTPGTKIRCLVDESFLTKGKTYEVIAIDYKDSAPMHDLEFWFIDDDGDEMYSSPEHEEFEVLE